LLDSPVSGGNPMAKAGTLAIMTGGDEETFEEVKFILECMGNPVYTGGPGSGDTTKLVNNTIAGAYLAAIAEGYAFAAKAGIDLKTTFEATRCGFAGGPLYENKVPMIIRKDYTPGARIAVHRKDILNAKQYAHSLGIDLPVTDVTLRIMDWDKDHGYIDEDQTAMVKYFEDKMNVDVGRKED
ncbi:MAG: NAD-binding protein, partial [Eubacteriales bacterium]|nr:NAD-binding protein [Eubacteriales bacterium]